MAIISYAVATDAMLAKSLFAHLSAIIFKAEIDVTRNEVATAPLFYVIEHIINTATIAANKSWFTETVFGDKQRAAAQYRCYPIKEFG